MFHRFRYESRYYPTLSRLPLHVRMKLDLTGIKVSLDDWLSFSFAERTALCHLPCDSDEETRAFRAYLDFLSQRYRGAPPEATAILDRALWERSRVPAAVREKSAESGAPVTAAEWLGWPSHQRYALYKTAISKSQPEAFADVLDELRQLRNLATGS
jgi:hypothetical protein